MNGLKHIGIIGVSSEGAALAYITLCKEGFEQLGTFIHPEITIHTLPLINYMDAIHNNDWDGVGNLMIQSVNKLKATGAEIAFCPDNTVHYAIEKVKKQSPIPVISITDTTTEYCIKNKYKTVGLLGTKYTVEGSLYKKPLLDAGINVLIPDESDIQIINNIIFSELGPGQITSTTIKGFIPIIRKLEAKQCDAIILGCTELPLVITNEYTNIPLIDTTRLQAKSVFALARES